MVKISVIIPACNEEKYISKNLESLKNQSFKNFEVIVVCNGCNDNTFKIAKKFGRAYNLDKKGISLAKNFGVEKSKGEILCFLDADSVIGKDMLKRVNELMKDYIGGSCVTVPDNGKLKARLMSWFFNLYKYNWGGFCFCRRDVFVKFNENLKMYEDVDFGRRIKEKGKIVFLRDIGVKTSMRRFEKNGYLKEFLYTLFGGLKKKEYKVVR